MRYSLFFVLCLVSVPQAQFLNAQCPSTKIDRALPTTTIIAPKEGDPFLRGSISRSDTAAQVQACIQGHTLAPVAIQADGSFVIPYLKELKGGEVISAQTFTLKIGEPPIYGDFTLPVKARYSCAKEVSDTSTSKDPITIAPGTAGPSFRVKGTAKGFSGKSLRVCKDDEPVPNALASIDTEGKYNIGTDIDTTGAKEIRVQIMNGDKPGILSQPYPFNDEPDTYRGVRSIIVGGYESFWYSSQGQKSEPFVKLFLEGPEFQLFDHNFVRYFAPWGEVRLLGAPQASTNGVGSTFTDPTGKINKQDFSTVGTAVDWQLGFDKFFHPPGPNWGRTSFIASIGATNPLSSQDSPIYFKVPLQGTAECAELLRRFTPANGYPVLTPGDTATVSCLKSAGIAVTDIAFTNQDRTNALWKWQAGVRAEGSLKCNVTYSDCSDSFGLLDLTIGQDAAMTRGQVRNFVFKADVTFPIKTGDKSYLYLYASSYLRLKHNVNSQPLLLTTESPVPTLPNAAVVVLPLRQPDRDFFRIGIGINVGQVLCKLSIAPCNSDPVQDAPAAADTPKPAKSPTSPPATPQANL